MIIWAIRPVLPERVSLCFGSFGKIPNSFKNSRPPAPCPPSPAAATLTPDVRVGSIAVRSGNPADTDPWGWSCGFYP